MDVPVPKNRPKCFLGQKLSVLQTDNICVADKQYLCCRQEDDLCGLVGGAMDLTTPRCQVQFPLPLFTQSQWRRFDMPCVFFPHQNWSFNLSK